jgi:hypothetical protein
MTNSRRLMKTGKKEKVATKNLGPRIVTCAAAWKTYVLYKTRNLLEENQRLGVVISACEKAFFQMEGNVATQHAALPPYETPIP